MNRPSTIHPTERTTAPHAARLKPVGRAKPAAAHDPADYVSHADDDTDTDTATNPPRAGDASEREPAREVHEPLGPDDPLAPLPFNPYKGNRGLTRAWHALKNSIAGFRTAIREESAFRQELTLAAILLPIGVIVPVAPVERAALLGSVLLVLIVELLNSSVEAAIDRISLERHELSRRAKDFGSAAVMIALLVCVLTWLLILVPAFGPPLMHWLRSR